MIELLIFSFFILIVTSLLMGGLFLLAIRLGLFEITWERFKIEWKNLSIKQMCKDICKSFKW